MSILSNARSADNRVATTRNARHHAESLLRALVRVEVGYAALLASVFVLPELIDSGVRMPALVLAIAFATGHALLARRRPILPLLVLLYIAAYVTATIHSDAQTFSLISAGQLLALPVFGLSVAWAAQEPEIRRAMVLISLAAVAVQLPVVLYQVFTVAVEYARPEMHLAADSITGLLGELQAHILGLAGLIAALLLLAAGFVGKLRLTWALAGGLVFMLLSVPTGTRASYVFAPVAIGAMAISLWIIRRGGPFRSSPSVATMLTIVITPVLFLGTGALYPGANVNLTHLDGLTAILERGNLPHETTVDPVELESASAPDVPLLDEFNRPDEGPPPSSDWEDFPGYSGLQVSSKQARASGSGWRGSRWKRSFSAPVGVHVRFPVYDRSSRLRIDLTKDQEGALVGYFVQLSPSGELRLWRVDGDPSGMDGISWIPLGGVTPVLPESGDELALLVDKDTVGVLWRKSGTWYEAITAADATYTAELSPGLWLDGAHGVDDFAAGLPPKGARFKRPEAATAPDAVSGARPGAPPRVPPGRIRQLITAFELSVERGVDVALLGRGIGAARLEVGAPITRPEQETSETWVSRTIAETGYLGLLAFFALIAYLIALWWRNREIAASPSWDAAVIYALPGITVLTLLGAFYGEILVARAYSALFWAILGLAIAIDATNRSQPRAASAQLD